MHCVFVFSTVIRITISIFHGDGIHRVFRTVPAWAEGYFPQTVTNVVVTGMGVTLEDFYLLPVHRFYLPLIVRN